MKSLAFSWGIGGILLLLGFAVYRLTPMALELGEISLSAVHWLALIFSVVYMAYAEGYRGFHQGFAPRVAVRAAYLRSNPRWDLILLAPVFCMGYIHATRRRKLLSFGITLMIICFVLIARQLPQPWRGIVDAGVVTGLCIGLASICYFSIRIARQPDAIAVSAEVPIDA